MDNQAEITYCEELRASLKNNGLFEAIRLMSVEERGLARRAIRNALETQIKWRKGELR